VRQNFWEVVAGMYAQAYFGQIADWCADHGTALSGHVLAEEDMWGNALFEVSVLEAVRRMQIPGIDILTADPEEIADRTFLGAKGVSSVAHLTGRDTVHCECCAFRPLPSGERLGLNEFIAQANMLHVMGVNLFTLYQSQRQIGEEAFCTYTDYVGRLSLMMRGGRHVCDVAMLYPVRSAWAWWTPSGRDMELPDRTSVGARFSRVADSYVDGCRTLAQSQIDFDVVDEQAIRDAEMRNGAMRIADEAYGTIVLWDPQALELGAAEALTEFCAAGGILIAVGQRPEMTDSAADEAAFDALMDGLFGEGGQAVVLEPDAVVAYIRKRCGADLELSEPNDRVFYTHRRRNGRDLYFIVNNGAEAVTLRPALRVPGPYRVYRPLTGDIEPPASLAELPLAPYEGVFLVTQGN
jgi:hypothetical protein